MPTPNISIAYAADGPVKPGRQIVVTSALDFEATVAALETAIAAEDLWVLTKVETQMLLAKGGFAIRPLRQILFFHPRYMARLLASNPAAVVEVPLKLVVMAGPDGAVSVRYPDIRAALASYPGLADLADDLAAALDRITSQTGPSARAQLAK
ncbi:MAG: DUF302 domain-containing protein [Hyphomicrobiaceae bacterium]